MELYCEDLLPLDNAKVVNTEKMHAEELEDIMY